MSDPVIVASDDGGPKIHLNQDGQDSQHSIVADTAPTVNQEDSPTASPSPHCGADEVDAVTAAPEDAVNEGVRTNSSVVQSNTRGRSRIAGEKIEDYINVEHKLRAGLKPTDEIEECWVVDLSDIIWQRRRLRRLRDALYAATFSAAVIAVMHAEEHLEQDLRWRDEKAMKTLDGWLDAGWVSYDMINVKSLQLESEKFEMLDRLDDGLTKRQILIMREIREHRAFAAVNAARIIDKIGNAEDAEYSDVERSDA